MKAYKKIVFETEVEEFKFDMGMLENAPLGHAYVAASRYMDEIVRLINEHAEKRSELEEEAKKEKKK